MAQGEFIAGYFTPLERPELKPPAGGIGGKPPVTKPPLPPGVTDPDPGTKPIDPDAEVQPPIFIPGTPEHPIVLPPGTIWPPVNPGAGLQGKILLLCWIPGVGSRWVVVELPPLPGWPPEGTPMPPMVPPAQPKR